jgi:hypothetical protein
VERSNPLDFLSKANEDPVIAKRVLAAVERGGKLMADEVMQIAEEFGYSFTKSEFQREVKRRFADRFAAGEEGLEDMAETTKSKKKPRPRPKPPESSCAKGCLSYTVSWHPPASIE